MSSGSAIVSTCSLTIRKKRARGAGNMAAAASAGRRNAHRRTHAGKYFRRHSARSRTGRAGHSVSRPSRSQRPARPDRHRRKEPHKTLRDIRGGEQSRPAGRYGEVYGLLGANGAGKTTTIKMLCGLLEPTEGTSNCAGETQQPAISDLCGSGSATCRRSSRSTTTFPIRENLDFFAGVYGVPESEREEKIGWVLSFSGLRRQREPDHR